MKKVLVLVSLLLLAAACVTQPTGNPNMTSNANTGGTKSSAGPSEADIIAKEKAGWDTFKRKDADAFKKLLAPDYFGVNFGGVEDTAASVAAMKDTEISDVKFADWKMTTIDKDAVLITYTATGKFSVKGKALPDGPYYEAAAYVNRNGEWVAIYYQETLQQKMEMPAASPTPAKAASSPMGKPAETTADVAANEKLVWDALKSGNYDAFAFYLADDSKEIEADGVYDKAGSVKTVQGMDLSKGELSDWKTVKFDDDASVVTYKVKLPPMKPGMQPDISYHSTIWVNRDGKWRAFFHMGTPAELPPAQPASPEKKM